MVFGDRTDLRRQRCILLRPLSRVLQRRQCLRLRCVDCVSAMGPANRDFDRFVFLTIGYCDKDAFTCTAPSTTAGASCNRQQACGSSFYCSASGTCQPQLGVMADCAADGSISCSASMNLYCSTSDASPGYQLKCLAQAYEVGVSCSADSLYGCAAPLTCGAATKTCQRQVTTVGGSCASPDYASLCGITTDGTQLFPSIPAGSSGHADCTCVMQADVVVRPSSRARARARLRRNLSLCPGSHTACPVGSGFECTDVEVSRVCLFSFLAREQY